MKWLKKLIIRIAWPKIKKIVLSKVNSEEYQKLIVSRTNEKLDIPGLSEKKEEVLLDSIYDAGQEATTELIENIDIEEALERIF